MVNKVQKSCAFAVAFLFMSLADAQLVEQLTISTPEPSEVVPLFAGSSIGLIPGKRVQLSAPAGVVRSTVRVAVDSSLEDLISESRRGVVFNKSMQAYGLLSGEITFAMQPGLDVNSLDWGSAPGPRPLGPPDVYVVNAATGAEFVHIFNILKKANAVKWVEPSVEYIPEAIE
jgi:hypothetical protein